MSNRTPDDKQNGAIEAKWVENLSRKAKWVKKSKFDQGLLPTSLTSPSLLLTLSCDLGWLQISFGLGKFSDPDALVEHLENSLLRLSMHN